jgi:hypothetical protein
MLAWLLAGVVVIDCFMRALVPDALAIRVLAIGITIEKIAWTEVGRHRQGHGFVGPVRECRGRDYRAGYTHQKTMVSFGTPEHQ